LYKEFYDKESCFGDSMVTSTTQHDLSQNRPQASMLRFVKQFDLSRLHPTKTVVRRMPVVGYVPPPSVVDVPAKTMEPFQHLGSDGVLRLKVDTTHAHGRLGDDQWPMPRAVAQCADDARPGYNSCSAHEYLDEPDILEKKVALVAELIRKSSRRVIYSGAGISTASGIMDYASKAEGSISKKLQKEKWAPKRPINPYDAQPTLAHKILTAMHAGGYLDYWVQQNHDGLPQKAGFPQHVLNEIHGAWYDPSNPVVPMNGNLRTDLFNDLLRWERDVDFCLVLGTSLCGMNSDRIVVSAANSFQENSKKAGGAVIVGLQSTKMDHLASVRIFATIDDMMRLLAKKLHMNLESEESKSCVGGGPENTTDEQDVFFLPYDSRSGKRNSDGRLCQFDFRENAFVRINGGPHNGSVGFVSGKNKEGHYKMTFFLSLSLQNTSRSKEDDSFASKISRKPHPFSCVMGKWWIGAAKCKSVPAMPVTCLDPNLETDTDDIEAAQKIMKRVSLGPYTEPIENSAQPYKRQGGKVCFEVEKMLTQRQFEKNKKSLDELLIKRQNT